MKILRSQLTYEERVRDDRRGVAVGMFGMWFGAGLCWLIALGMAVWVVNDVVQGTPEDAPWIPAIMFWVLSIIAVFVVVGTLRLVRGLREATARLIEDAGRREQ